MEWLDWILFLKKLKQTLHPTFIHCTLHDLLIYLYTNFVNINKGWRVGGWTPPFTNLFKNHYYLFFLLFYIFCFFCKSFENQPSTLQPSTLSNYTNIIIYPSILLPFMLLLFNIYKFIINNRAWINYFPSFLLSPSHSVFNKFYFKFQ